MKNSLASLCLSVGAFAALSISASAETLSLGASSDATIRSDNTAANGNTNVQLVGTLPAGVLRSVYSFDLASQSALVGATINSVTLTFTVNDASEHDGAGSESVGGVFQIDLHLLSSGFTETGVTWVGSGVSAWGTPGGDFSPTVLSSVSGNPSTVAAGAKLIFPSSAALIQAVSTSVSGTSSLNLMMNLGDETTGLRNIFRITSSEPNAVPGSYAPLLTIDYTPVSSVPEPSAFAAIAGIGALGFVASRRRRR